MNLLKPGSWLVVFALCACSATRQATTTDATATQSVAAHDALNAIAWQRRSDEYRLIAEQTYRNATSQLQRALADAAWDALPPSDRDTPASNLPPAVILDIDETVLDNGAFQAELVRQRRGFDSAAWSDWVRAARAPAVPGAVEFIRSARARGVAVYFVTNRAVELTEPTLANLRKVGIAVDDPGRVLGRGTPVAGCVEGSEKHCRRRLIGRNHRVLLQIGDQRADLVSAADFATASNWMGERWFLLPNPIYGSWESALFDDDWSLDESTRRQRKLEAIGD